MSDRFIAALLGMSLTGGGATAIHLKYSVDNKQRAVGDKRQDSEGKEEVFIGYTGVPEDVANKIKEQGTQRELFTTKSKGEAQKYAITGSAPGKTPVVMEVWGKHLPKEKDLAMQWFEGPHAPLSPEGARSVGVKIGEIEPVTKKNQLGFGASVNRFLEDITKK